MRNARYAVFAAILAASACTLVQSTPEHPALYAAMTESVPFVGGDYAAAAGYDGRGVTIAIIDTGISADHPDITGISGGVNYVGDGPPSDISGHGTQVAGIIAADGTLRGVAPGANITSYKVSEDGDSVSPDLIVRAIEDAVIHGADIINISLGVNRTNPVIDNAIHEAVQNGVVVVTAAGNDGPDESTIGSPGSSADSITVGATYNDSVPNLVAALEVDGARLEAVPMVGTEQPDDIIEGDIVFANYAGASDFDGETFRNTIVLAERGSADEDELLYFSIKEANAADAGALAILVYNNEEGMFLGELLHDMNAGDYAPRIPALSISRSDGLAIRDSLEDGAHASISIFSNPDHVAYFSSRGPVSPFYAKPDIVAPGVFVNTTTIGGEYNLTDGTSMAAPHVSGAAALLLQKNPDLVPSDIKSILITTATPIRDEYDRDFDAGSAGAGRLDIAGAIDSRYVLEPPRLAFHMRAGESEDATISVRPLDGAAGDITVSHDLSGNATLRYAYENGTITVSAFAHDGASGDIHGRITVYDGDTKYAVPVIITITDASLSALQEGGHILADVQYHGEWEYAKVESLNSRTQEVHSASASPEKPARLPIDAPGIYWLTASVSAKDGVVYAYDTISIESGGAYTSIPWDIPARQIVLIAIIMGAVAAAGVLVRRSRARAGSHYIG